MAASALAPCKMEPFAGRAGGVAVAVETGDLAGIHRLQAENDALRRELDVHKSQLVHLKAVNTQLLHVSVTLLQGKGVINGAEPVPWADELQRRPIVEAASSMATAESPLHPGAHAEAMATLSKLVGQRRDTAREMGSAFWRVPPGCTFTGRCYVTKEYVKPVFAGPRGGWFFWQNNNRKRYVKADEPRLVDHHIADLEKMLGTSC